MSNKTNKQGKCSLDSYKHIHSYEFVQQEKEQDGEFIITKTFYKCSNCGKKTVISDEWSLDPENN